MTVTSVQSIASMIRLASIFSNGGGSIARTERANITNQHARSMVTRFIWLSDVPPTDLLHAKIPSLLNYRHSLGQHATVKLPRLAWLLVALPVLTGCESPYTHLRVTNPRGEAIADWVAMGHVCHVEEGYRITALERTDAPPSHGTVRYPDGWRVTVVGPYVHQWPCDKPAWFAPEEGK